MMSYLKTLLIDKRGQIMPYLMLFLLALMATNFIFVPLAAAQQNSSPGVFLRTSAGPNLGGRENHDSLMPLIFFCVCLILILLFVITLWPKPQGPNQLQRQRMFARVDNLFLQVTLTILDPDESKNFMKFATKAPEATNNLAPLQEPAAITSLSVAGCTLRINRSYERGSLIILDLGKLPDFPYKEFPIAFKTVWCKKADPDNLQLPYTVGGTFLLPETNEHREALKKYLNFLLEEPLS